MKGNNEFKYLFVLVAIALLFFDIILLSGSTVNAASKTIKFDCKSYIMHKGDKKTIKLENAKSKISWSSINPKVARVNSKGKVTALKNGTTKIIATVKNKSYVCTVKVVNTVKFNYKGHKYMVIDYGLTWSKAKKYCESLGGHLITINSAGEQKALVKHLKKNSNIKRNNYWLGAKKDSNGDMKWITKEKFSYASWAPNQPDNSYENCLMIYRYDNLNTNGDDSYLWNDLVNNGTFGSEEWFGLKNFGFICEWE